MPPQQIVGDQHERIALRRRPGATADHTAHAEGGQAPHPLVALGGQIGNAQVERMLAQRDEMPEEEEEIQAQHDTAQREGEEDEEMIQAKPEVGLEGGPLGADLSGRIDAQRGGGAPLNEGSRTSMEGAFDTGFEDVRVHTGAEADALNRSISAKAFTTGSDIFFREDSSPSDQGLLAHELTHVVQQRGAVGGGGAMQVGPAGDSSEQHAEAVSAAVTSGAAAQAQREEDAAQAQRQLAQREGELEDEEAS